MDTEWIINRRFAILDSQQNPTNSTKTLEIIAGDGFDVIVTIADYNYCLSWKAGPNITLRHYQCTFSDYPEASDWELQHLNEYLLYEIDHDRKVILWSESADASQAIKNSVSEFFKYKEGDLSTLVKSKLASQVERARKIPPKLTHCRACKEEGCITDLVCHVTSVVDAERVLTSGVLLSACEVRNVSGQALAREESNVAGDPPDYFEYVMFTFGNCIAGDRLLLERNLGRAPTDTELAEELRPGVRFYFSYADLVEHPGFFSDGYHFCKVKDKLEIEPYLIVAVALSATASRLSRVTPQNLIKRMIFIEQAEHIDLWDWSHAAYEAARRYYSQPDREDNV